MPDEIASFRCRRLARFVDKQALTASGWAATIMLLHHFGDGAPMFLGQIMGCAPEDDQGKFSPDGIVVVSVAVEVGPASDDRIDIQEDIVSRGLGIGRGSFDFGNHFPDGCLWDAEVKPSGPTRIGPPL